MMTTTPLAYWTPGAGEERQLRIFISHRYGGDRALYGDVILALNRSGFSVQDISLSAEQALLGPRGGKLPNLRIHSEIAARIYTSDILIAPSRPAVTRAEWVTWEVKLAAIGYGIPILFVNERNHKRRTTLLKEIAELGLEHRACEPDAQKIVRNVAELVRDSRPRWGVRQEEADNSIRFRGPTRAALDTVMKKHPFTPSIAPFDPPPTLPRRTIWPFFSRRS